MIVILNSCFFNGGHLRELNLIISHLPKDVLDYYMQLKLMPPRVSMLSTIKYSYYSSDLFNYATHLTTIPTVNTENFRVYTVNILKFL